MFDILDFIDSKDIRQHNADTCFTPMEQAILIYHSERTTVEEKITAWKELLARYGEDDFKMLSYGERQFVKRSNRQLVADTLWEYEEVLRSRYTVSNVVFAARFEEIRHPRPDELSYFTDYDSAFAFLKAEKQHYLDDDALKEVQTKASISIIPLNQENDRNNTKFYFDTNLRMTDLYFCSRRNGEGGQDGSLDDTYIAVPVPFKKGDILKCIDANAKYDYGVLPGDVYEDERLVRIHIKSGDSSDMILSLDNYDNEDDLFNYGHYSLLHLEKCTWHELPEGQKALILLSQAYQGKIVFGEVMRYYSMYGSKAFEEIEPYLRKGSVD